MFGAQDAERAGSGEVDGADGIGGLFFRHILIFGLLDLPFETGHEAREDTDFEVEKLVRCFRGSRWGWVWGWQWTWHRGWLCWRCDCRGWAPRLRWDFEDMEAPFEQIETRLRKKRIIAYMF